MEICCPRRRATRRGRQSLRARLCSCGAKAELVDSPADVTLIFSPSMKRKSSHIDGEHHRPSAPQFFPCLSLLSLQKLNLFQPVASRPEGSAEPKHSLQVSERRRAAASSVFRSQPGTRRSLQETRQQRQPAADVVTRLFCKHTRTATRSGAVDVHPTLGKRKPEKVLGGIVCNNP